MCSIAWRACRLPVVAAVNGLALAGGLELVLCCDLVIAEASAQLGDAHANYGLLPGGGASARLPRKIGPTAAKYWLFTGLVRPASELAGTGLLNAVVADGTLSQHVDELVALLATQESARARADEATGRRRASTGRRRTRFEPSQRRGTPTRSPPTCAREWPPSARSGLPRFVGR